MQETRVQSLGGEDPLEKGMATHSSILAWRIPWTEEPGRLQSMMQGVGHDWGTNTLFLAVLGLCCSGVSLVAVSRGYSALHRLLAAVASFVAEHRLEGSELQELQHVGSVVVVPQL